MRGADSVNHVREAVEVVVLQRDGVAARVNDAGEVADGVVGVIRRSFGRGPAAGEAVVGVVTVNEDEVVASVEFVRDGAIDVIIPGGGLAFTVGEGEEVAGGAVSE